MTPSPASAGEGWKGTDEIQGIAMSGIAEHEIGDHNSAEDCWVVIKKQVYDITTFLDEHPGGKDIILEYAGKDATEAFEVRLIEWIPVNTRDVGGRVCVHGGGWGGIFFFGLSTSVSSIIREREEGEISCFLVHLSYSLIHVAQGCWS
jgi:hypothetical protein